MCIRDRAFRELRAPDLPAVGLSWTDASAYAAWLSARTGQRWRLPTYAECCLLYTSRCV